MTGNLIDIQRLSRSFDSPAGQVSVLREISLTIPQGSFTVIRGPSGVGKSTLLRILGLLDTQYEGVLRLGEADVATLSEADRDELRTSAIGFVFQDGRLLPHLSLEENILLPLQLSRVERSEAAHRMAAAAEFAFRPEERAAGILAQRPGIASGGQCQRAALARAMISQPALILADEPTASLDSASRAQVIDRLRALHAAGATLVVVSHDEALFGIGRQFQLDAGRLVDLTPAGASAPAPRGRQSAPVAIPRAPLGGWWPRLGPGRLCAGAVRNLLRRPLLTALMLMAVLAGSAQTAIFASLVSGLDRFVEQTIADGSRLIRITLKPRRADAGGEDHFPGQAELASAPDVTSVVARRATTISVLSADGSNRPFPSLGLHPDDPEISLFRFVAGGGFTPGTKQLEMIATTDFLTDLKGPPAEGGSWNDDIGRQVKAEIPRFGRSGKQVGVEHLVLTIVGIILKGEGDRQFYLANDLLVAIDAIKRDRGGKLELPLTPDLTAWAEGVDRGPLVNWPWQDMLHVYVRDVDAVIPKIAALSEQGYRPEAEVWKYSWVLNMKAAAYGIAAPMLGLVSCVVGLILLGNIVISTRLREAELALMKVLGMRRGDVLATEVIGTLITAAVGLAVGFVIADRLISTLVAKLRDSARIAAELSGDAAADRVSLLFQPVSTVALPIAAATVALVLLAVFWPTVRAAKTDPAKVFSR